MLKLQSTNYYEFIPPLLKNTSELGSFVTKLVGIAVEMLLIRGCLQPEEVSHSHQDFLPILRL